MARPSGRKLEAIRLLSTGERVLTDIALLFNMYWVRRSPFCILDGLGAPPDDANIGRFVTLLRHFSERARFVVITNNSRTIPPTEAVLPNAWPSRRHSAWAVGGACPMERAVGDVSHDIRLDIRNLRRVLVGWRRSLGRIWLNAARRIEMGTGAARWSDRILWQPGLSPI